MTLSRRTLLLGVAAAAIAPALPPINIARKSPLPIVLGTHRVCGPFIMKPVGEWVNLPEAFGITVITGPHAIQEIFK